ncbi:MAG: Ldh family oxidoreductase [Paracoccaceae bacterium]|nr:Ldh family oxidoreductase [Paracoccaceae bacterium]
MEISLASIFDQSRAALIAHGAAPWVADTVAQAVRRAEATGNKICGLYYLESYCQQLVTGRVSGTVEPVVSQPKDGVVKVDAGFGFAQAGFARGLPKAVEVARKNGICLLAVGQAHTCTSLGFFTEQIAAEGLIGLGVTNASSIVSAPGGKDRILGTNPMSFAVPDASGGVAMKFDFSTSAVALGKITMAKAAGQKIPLGWAVDKDGNPTDDPAAAIEGALVSAGGYKGWGLGLMVEILAAGLTGSVNSLDVAGLKLPDGKPHDLGQTYILIDPGFQAAFQDRLKRVFDAVEADEGARIPGATDTSMDAVDVDKAMVEKLAALADA